jgi:hypothetical protein
MWLPNISYDFFITRSYFLMGNKTSWQLHRIFSFLNNRIWNNNTWKWKWRWFKNPKNISVNVNCPSQKSLCRNATGRTLVLEFMSSHLGIEVLVEHYNFFVEQCSK